jgi:hypothetical protein
VRFNHQCSWRRWNCWLIARSCPHRPGRFAVVPFQNEECPMVAKVILMAIAIQLLCALLMFFHMQSSRYISIPELADASFHGHPSRRLVSGAQEPGWLIARFGLKSKFEDTMFLRTRLSWSITSRCCNMVHTFNRIVRVNVSFLLTSSVPSLGSP